LRLMLHLRRQSPFRRISKIANLSAARICENRDSVVLKGGKNFPAPVVRVTTESPLWDWVDVARGLYRQGKLTLPDLLRARVVRGENIKILERQRDHLTARQSAKASARAA
jgi:hypothetical protein